MITYEIYGRYGTISDRIFKFTPKNGVISNFRNLSAADPWRLTDIIRSIVYDIISIVYVGPTTIPIALYQHLGHVPVYSSAELAHLEFGK